MSQSHASRRANRIGYAPIETVARDVGSQNLPIACRITAVEFNRHVAVRVRSRKCDRTRRTDVIRAAVVRSERQRTLNKREIRVRFIRRRTTARQLDTDSRRSRRRPARRPETRWPIRH